MTQLLKLTFFVLCSCCKDYSVLCFKLHVALDDTFSPFQRFHFLSFFWPIFSVMLELNLTKTEDGGEESVADLEGEGDCPALVVVLDPHRHHVQEDEDKDGDLKASRE